MKRAPPLLVLLLALTNLPGFVPAPLPPAGAVKPAQVSASKPDGNGLVTLLRPVVTRLSPDDPFRIALHWAKPKGPLTHSDLPAGGLSREATLFAMKFHLTTPGGAEQVWTLDGKANDSPGGWGGMYYRPTYLLTLTPAGVEAEQNKKWSWAGGKRLDLTRPGAYRLRITGTLVRDKAAPLSFQSEPINLAVDRTVRSQAQVLAIARDAVRPHLPAADLAKSEVFLRDDSAGNALVAFRTPGMLWSHLEVTIPVRPDGKALAPTKQEIGNCVAGGTIVATERGPRPIEQVRVGEKVWGRDLATGRNVLTTVRFVRVGQAGEVLVFRGGLAVTANHPVWAGEWKRAGSVGPRDPLLDQDGQLLPAGNPVVRGGPVTVYDLTVDEPHCFFAGGFLVHNKSRPYSPRLDDPWYDRWPEMLLPRE